MSSKKIYLIRHGQTDYNLNGIVQGSGVDADLNHTGRLQAQAFFDHYKHIVFDKIYTSALVRSIQSVEGFINKNIPHEALAGFNEISWGHMDGKIITSEDNNVYWEMVNEWKRGNVDKKINGGESPREVQNRIKPMLELVFSRENEKTILICMHGRAMRILLATLFHGDLAKMDDFEHHNLGLYLLERSSNQLRIEKRNDINHLNSVM